MKVERLAVVGLGLLGGSVALAARRRGAAREVVGATRSADASAAALASGAVDRILPLAEVALDADLVVLATPVGAMAAAVRQMSFESAASFAQRAEGERRRSGVVVTDVGSVKAPLVDTLPGLLPPGCPYVGSHPMAGSHHRGMSHARADLFEGAVCVVTEAADPRAGARVIAFWEALGARVVRRTAAQHDAEVAWVSHLPHLLAFAFAGSLAAAPAAAAELAGAGFRDFTRIARSDAELWADILTENRKALAAPLGAAGAQLEAIAKALEAGDAEGLDRLLSAARSALFPAPPVSTESRDPHARGDRSKGDPD
ncbi:MAG TPA: prephenate dehydrogenase [Myxococcota bacterium]|nr:prephenate dehydrogenase [Myxococcota bacterium]